MRSAFRWHVVTMILGGGLACDWPEAGKDAPAAAVPPAKEQAAAAPTAEPVRGARDRCIAGCNADTTLSPTDLRTCRLNCEEAAGRGSVESAGALEQFAACRDRCEGDAPDKSDRETCALTCVESATSRAKDRACTRACLDTLLGCERGCVDVDGEADRSTCRAHCGANAGSCLERCR